jgi:hypothetical protein
VRHCLHLRFFGTSSTSTAARVKRTSSVRRCAALLLVVLIGAGETWAVQRTETRKPCTDHNPLRNPYFGDTHVHTSFSFDASALGVRVTPKDAYRFARGEPLAVRPYDTQGQGRRTARLRRPLDFTVVTDHAEMLGETTICNTPSLAGHGSLVCRIYRRWPLLSYYLVNSRIFNVSDPRRYRFCGADGQVCRDTASVAWKRLQEAAEEAYDRSSGCRFTTFVGYEWSGNPDSNMIHRNVIFRNAVVPDYPTSYVDEPSPQGLWRSLRATCLDLENECDVLAIPHNSNLSAGWLFRTHSPDGTPITKEEAAERADLEPLVEIMQHKGDSECRLGGATEDELCGFEKLPFGAMDQRPFPFLWKKPGRMSFVRDVLAEGLVQQDRLGVNPFKLGLIAATDTHEGTPGLVAEEDFIGHAAGGDTNAVEISRMPDAIEFNPGGLAVLWAEENSRDALFEAMRRREVYGTSGPRMIVRFFGGWNFQDDMCDGDSFVERGYRDGVPMGGELPPPSPDAKPAFAVWALKDPGTAERSGTPLQRIQIVKAWVEGDQSHQKVFEVAGDPYNGATVDVRTCQPQGPGANSLCAVWRDPFFDPAQQALYYARVIQNPSCRWSAYACNAHGVDCADSRTVPADLRSCCDTAYPRTIQERAWTSPVWYAPADR